MAAVAAVRTPASSGCRASSFRPRASRREARDSRSRATAPSARAGGSRSRSRRRSPSAPSSSAKSWRRSVGVSHESDSGCVADIRLAMPSATRIPISPSSHHSLCCARRRSIRAIGFSGGLACDGLLASRFLRVRRVLLLRVEDDTRLERGRGPGVLLLPPLREHALRDRRRLPSRRARRARSAPPLRSRARRRARSRRTRRGRGTSTGSALSRMPAVCSSFTTCAVPVLPPTSSPGTCGATAGAAAFDDDTAKCLAHALPGAPRRSVPAAPRRPAPPSSCRRVRCVRARDAVARAVRSRARRRRPRAGAASC